MSNMYMRELELAKRRNIAKQKKDKLLFSLHYPKKGDTVVFGSFTITGVYKSSGIGKVIFLEYYSTPCHAMFKIQTTDGTIHEVITNSRSYKHDFIEVIDVGDGYMYYMGYDSLTKSVIPNTMATFKTDCETELCKLFGNDWKTKHQFIEIREVEITVK